MPHPSLLPIDELLAACSISTLRRGGPGGQHRNKVETAVAIEHRPTGIRAEASERRSQADNRRVAIQRLRLTLAVEHREIQSPHLGSAASDANTRDSSTGSNLNAVSELWRSRTVNGRIQASVEHGDFPALLAELLDQLWRDGFEMPASSKHFQVSGSQLVGLLRSYPPALAAVNARRHTLGLHKLR